MTGPRIPQQDSVPAALFGDPESGNVRKQLLARLAEVAKTLVSKGPGGLVDMERPPAPIMRGEEPTLLADPKLARMFGVQPETRKELANAATRKAKSGKGAK